MPSAWRPVARPEDPQRTSSTNTIGVSDGARRSGVILVVDDYGLIRFLVRSALEDEGYVVAEAADGAEALQVAKAMAPSLIFLDVSMPVLDGPGFVAAYRNGPEPQAPIVMMTGSKDEVHLLTALGAAGCLRKPFDIGVLLAFVARFVGAPDPAPPEVTRG